MIGLVVEIVDQFRRQVLGKNASGSQLLTILLLGQVRMTSERRRCLPYRGIKGQIFECVERVVMDKDLDRRLDGEQVSGVLDRLADRLESLLVVTRLRRTTRKRGRVFHS